jgi:hypothetical protein
MSNISIKLIPVSGLEFSVTRKNLKWAYQDGAEYFATIYDEEVEGERDVKITQVSYEALYGATYDLPLVTAAADDLDNPVAVGSTFVISDANIVLGSYAQPNINAELPAVTTWDTASTGTGSFTMSNSGTIKVWTGVAVSVISDNARIEEDFIPVGGTGSAVVTFGTNVLGAFEAGTEFDFELLDESDAVIKSFTTAELASANVVTVAIPVGVEAIQLRATALTAAEDLSTLIIRVVSVALTLDSGVWTLDAGYNTNLDYNFRNFSFSFGVEEVLPTVAGASIYLQVGEPLDINYSPWTLGFQGLISAGTRLSLVEDAEDADRCYTRLDKPQGLVVVHWDNDVDYMEDYFLNI